MRNLILIFIAILVLGCSDDDGNVDIEYDGVRFIDSVFSEVNIVSNIQYGENVSLGGVNKKLFLDVYFPVNDTTDIRPTIVLAHGGAFIGGNKTDLKELCIEYAERGYTVASIGYNLIDDRFISDSVRFAEGVVIALGDMKGSIRFLRDNALNGDNDFGIDPDLIFVGGISAGAVLANHAGFWDENDSPIPGYLQAHIDNNGGFEGDTNNIDASSSVSGVISFSGSIFRTKWIDENDPPVFIVHEELDPIVPCGYDASEVFPFPVIAYGGCEIAAKIEDLGLSGQFIYFEGADDHVGYFTSGDEALEKELVIKSATFIESLL